MRYRIAIVDDKSQNRISLSEKITYSGEVEIVFMARNGADCLTQLKALPPTQHPQLIFMDIDMPVMGGIEAVRACHTLYKDIRYVMLTVFDDDDKLFEAIRAGADGYLLKEEKIGTIINAMREVIEQQGAPMSTTIARKALNLLAADRKETKDIATNLSDRELEILQGLVNGYDYKKIAANLFISPFTVRTHITNIYEKLQVSSKVQAVKMAIKNKWF